jgi:hypothetical protein
MQTVLHMDAVKSFGTTDENIAAGMVSNYDTLRSD